MSDRLVPMSQIRDVVGQTVKEITGEEPRKPWKRMKISPDTYLYQVLDHTRRRVQRQYGTDNWQPTQLDRTGRYFYSHTQVEQILDELTRQLDHNHILGIRAYRRIPLNEQILQKAKQTLLKSS